MLDGLTLEDFSIEVWNNVSPNVLSEQMYEINKEFFKSLTYDYYNLYDKMNGAIGINVFARALESVISNLNRFGYDC